MNKEEQKIHRKEYMREYLREYKRKLRLDNAFRERERAYYREWYKRNGRNRDDNHIESILEWKQEHPDRVKISRKLQYAVQTGEVIKPLFCERCGRKARLSGHHEDYSKPLKVIWLCSSCHKIRHGIK